MSEMLGTMDHLMKQISHNLFPMKDDMFYVSHVPGMQNDIYINACVY